MDYKIHFYPESRFGGFTDIDGTIAFYARIRALAHGLKTVVDVGCGRGAADPVPLKQELRDLRSLGAKVVGIDVDPNAQANPLLDEFRLITEQKWPIGSDYADLVICDNVIEHVEDPEVFFLELARISKPGAFVCIRTPNVWGYVSLAARLIANRYHGRVLSYVQPDRRELDVFPTVYRCNSKWKLRKALTGVGFDSVVYGYEAEPSYLSFSRFAYTLGVLHQKLAPSAIRVALFAFGQKNR